MRKIAGFVFICLSSLMIIIHVLIVAGIMPSSIIWGGSIQNDGQLYLMESIAIIVLIIFSFIQAVKSQILKMIGPPMIWTMLSFMVLVYLLLNTLGNFASDVTVEKIFFGSMTIIMSIASAVILIKKD
jgi:hypothetical protein